MNPIWEQINIGMPVKCKNCGLKWLRVTANDNPGGVVSSDAIQYNCPNCGSNWYEYEVIEGEVINER